MPEVEHPQDDFERETNRINDETRIFLVHRGTIITLIRQLLEPVNPGLKDEFLEPITQLLDTAESKIFTLQSFADEMTGERSPIANRATALVSAYYGLYMLLKAMKEYITSKDGYMLIDVLTTTHYDE